MGFPIYDYRKDFRNVLVTPQIRSRFKRMEVGEVSQGHSHDLGQEIFLILQGKVEFEIDGQKEVLEPGQLCVALVDQSHAVRNVGDEEAIIYLSVTPHIQPTHTSWTEQNEKIPKFSPSGAYDVYADTTVLIDELLDHHLRTVVELARRTAEAVEVHREKVATIGKALSSGDEDAVRKAKNEMWQVLSPMYTQSFDLARVWNDLAGRLTDVDYQE